MPNLAAISGIDDMRMAVTPLFSLRYHWWWLLVDPNVLRDAYPSTRLSDRLDSPLVGDFNIAYVLQGRLRPFDVFWSLPDIEHRDRFLSPWLVPPRFPVAMVTASILVHANRASPVRPRVHFVPRVVRVDDMNAAIRTLTANRNLPLSAAVVEHRGDLTLPEFATGEANVAYPDDAHAIVDVRSPTGGLVVLHDSFDRGWSATIDAKPAEILPVNILSRGVIVPRGVHRIVFSYSPPGFRIGVVISLMTLALLIVFTRRSRNTRAPFAVNAVSAATALMENASSPRGDDA